MKMDQIAGMIVEPMMMNAGIIPPQPGYLEGVRDLTRAHGVFLAFDEVKTGLVVSWGGATRLFGVTPDIVCLAKALGGGLPCGAIGGTGEVMSAITDGVYDQIGTFNGNPLTMAAAKATLLEVLTPAVYGAAEGVGRRMLQGSMGVLAAHGQPSYRDDGASQAHSVVTPVPGRLDFRLVLNTEGVMSRPVAARFHPLPRLIEVVTNEAPDCGASKGCALAFSQYPSPGLISLSTA